MTRLKIYGNMNEKVITMYLSKTYTNMTSLFVFLITLTYRISK